MRFITVEELNVLITADSNQLRKEIQNTQKQILGLQKEANRSSSSMLKSFKFLTKGIIALGIGKIISSQIGTAISRLDTLNNYTKVMSNLGIGADESKASLKRLSDALIGLPTTLDAASMSVQRFTSANGNVKASTEIFLALNNAILAGGAGIDIQRSALEQLSQAYAKGKPDMMEWRSAMTAMPAQLKQVALAMGYASADQLGESLRNGTVSMNELMVKLVELNKTGANGFKSFEEQARNATGGVGTSIINIKTAFARGLADIMNAIGQSNIAGFFNNITKAINAVIPYITGFVKTMVWAVSSINSLFGKPIKKKVDETQKAVTGLGATSGGTAAKGLDKATGSAKKLKKELGGLAAFDEMNVLQDNSGSGGGSDESSGGTGSLSGIEIPDFSAANDELSKADQIAARLQESFGAVGKILKDIWDSKPVQTFVNFATLSGETLLTGWQTLSGSFIKNSITTWDGVSGNVQEALKNTSDYWTIFWGDLSAGVEKWGQPIIDGVNGVFNSIWKDVIEPAVTTISKVWADFSEIMVNKWNEHGKPLINNIGEFATKTIQFFQKIWDDVLEPIVTPFLETLSWLWDKHLKGLIQNVTDLVTSVVNGALEIYNKFILPIITNLIDKLAPAWSFISNLVVGVFGSILASATDTISAIIKVLKGIIDFISGIFTGNWKKAWTGVKDIFAGVMNGLDAIVKLPLNVLIDLINAFIKGINKIKVPDWVPGAGGKSLSIPTIPKLATGAVISKPTVAMIGEAGREVIMPLERNTGWIDQLANKINGARSDGNPVHIVVNIGEDTIIDKMIDGINQKSFETNGGVVYA